MSKIPLIQKTGWKRRKMYREGRLYCFPAELIEDLRNGRWVMYRGVPKHPAVLESMTLHTVMSGMACGNIRKAVKNEEPIP